MQIMNKWAGGLLLAFFASSAQGTTLPQLKVEDLFKEADVVVIAEIQSGHRVTAGEYPCGAKYEAKIIHSLKGKLKNESIVEFGPYLGHGIGNKYLLFLKARGSRYEPMTSSTGAILSVMAESEKKCAPSEAAYNIMFHGLGALEIGSIMKVDENYEFSDAIKFRVDWILPPTSLEQVPVEVGDTEVRSTQIWVRKDAFIEHIRELKVPENGIIND